jgi:hypothetical protein
LIVSGAHYYWVISLSMRTIPTPHATNRTVAVTQSIVTA